jgi:uncharacterized small protein (DUF1192 family)
MEMNLKPKLLTILTNLGVTEPEFETPKARMMFSVTSLEAQVDALNAQIATLAAQREAAQQELSVALLTASKLIDQVV